MITVQAYNRYKAQSTSLLDFTVLVSYAVPALRDDIDVVRLGAQPSLHRPDFFAKSSRATTEQLSKTAASYETYLAAYLLLAHFSFFEAFVSDAILEMIDFQGGAKEFAARTDRRSKKVLRPQSSEVVRLKRKLQDSEKPAWRQRYTKYARQLAHRGFAFPGDLLAAYGVQPLVQKLGNLRAVDVPDLLTKALQMRLSDTEIENYQAIRQIRNRVAHGKSVSISMKQAVQMNKALRVLAVKISNHLAENFFLIERYAP